MVYAAIVQCPVPGGTLASVDELAAKKCARHRASGAPADAVAVVANRYVLARQAGTARLHPEWNVGAAGTTDSAQFAKEYRDAALTGTAPVARNDGDVDAALAVTGAKDAVIGLRGAVISHTPRWEPMNATVHLQPDRLDVWVGNAIGDRTLTAAATIAGLKPEQVYIHNTFIGGGFGRKSKNDEMVQAIQIAKSREPAGEAYLDARGRRPPRPLPAASGDQLQGRGGL